MNKILQQWINNTWVHILAWLFLIFYETILTGLIIGTFAHPLVYLTHYIINIGFFYFCGDVAMPWALNNLKKSFWRLPLSLCFGICCFVLFGYAIDRFLVDFDFLPSRGIQVFNMEYLLRVLYRCFYFLGFAVGYYFLLQFIRNRAKAKALEIAHYEALINIEKMDKMLAKAQNAFLKSQIKPHFLFNTLDYVYHNLEEDSNAANAILELSQMMRFAIEADADIEFVSLWDEIQQSKKLINIYQLRAGFNLNILTDFDENLINFKFLPLILLTLIENIFKHGDLHDKQNPASISASRRQNRLEIETRNLPKKLKQSRTLQSGLNNIESRLKFTYGKEVNFTYGLNQQGLFVSRISLNL